MKKDKEVKCDLCQELKIRRKVKKIGSFCKCYDCIKIKRLEHREFLKREICGIRKRRTSKEVQEERERETKVPKIKGSKEKRKLKNSHLYLTRVEKEVLFRKYLKQGLVVEEIRKKIKENLKYLSDLTIKLREQRKSEIEVNRIFKEEFAKLLEETKCH